MTEEEGHPPMTEAETTIDLTTTTTTTTVQVMINNVHKAMNVDSATIDSDKTNVNVTSDESHLRQGQSTTTTTTGVMKKFLQLIFQNKTSTSSQATTMPITSVTHQDASNNIMHSTPVITLRKKKILKKRIFLALIS